MKSAKLCPFMLVTVLYSMNVIASDSKLRLNIDYGISDSPIADNFLYDDG